MEIVWSDLALASLTDILAYVDACFGKSVAQRVYKQIFLNVNRLKEKPFGGRIVKVLDNGNEIRYVLYKYNRIYFQIFDNKIEIIIVWDGRQDPKRLGLLINKWICQHL